MNRTIRQSATTAVAAAAFFVAPAVLTAQGRLVPPPAPGEDSATVAPGPRYRASGVHRWILGSDWRDLWSVPLTLPVLTVGTFAGGLDPQDEGGNNQSITLHMEDGEGQEWIFRSLDKYPGQKLDMGGLADWLVQDQVSSLHPAGQLVVPPLLDALGILHVEPTLYVMADDPALDEFRETFAGMVGALEIQPNEGEDDTPGFAGSRKVVGWEALTEHLEESPVNRVDQRELVRARLFDFLIGDTDRATDQWRWARFPDPDRPGAYLWRPIPRDRDWTFVSGDGAASHFIRMLYPKVVAYGTEIPDVEALTFSSHIVDRTLLTGLERDAFREEADAARRRLTDAVIRDAVDRLPPRYPAAHRERLVRTLIARRDALTDAALRFYDWLATDVDVQATDEPDRADLVRRDDGTVEVTLRALEDGAEADDGDVGGTEPYYRRVFRPGETNEVRVFLHGGDDVAVVRGSSGAIPVRVLGGGGDDVLADSSGAGHVHLYDDRGDNRFVRADGTNVDTRPYEPPPPPEGIRLGSDWAPDYGHAFGWTAAFEFGEYAGVVVGAGPRWVDYGFRRLPHHWSLQVTPMFALAAEKPGARLRLDYRPENSLHSLELGARWSEFDAIRWFGTGNDTDLVSEHLSLVPLDRVEVDPTLVFRFGTWRASGDRDEPEGIVVEDETPSGFRAAVSVGGVAAHVDAEPRPGGPFDLAAADRSDPVWELGVRGSLGLEKVDRTSAPRRGFRLDAGATAYPGVDQTDPFGTGHATVRGYVPLPGDAHLALRLGGLQAWGDAPPWHAPALGGRATIRGFEFMRFSGEAAAFGNAELRVPVLTASLLVRGRVGLLGLADAGRVWVDGESTGDWHTAVGGGAWFAGAGQVFSVYFARGERDQLYLSLGMPF